MCKDQHIVKCFEEKSSLLRIYIAYVVPNQEELKKEFESRFDFEHNQKIKFKEYQSGTILLQRSNYSDKYLEYRSIKCCLPKCGCCRRDFCVKK